MNGIKLFIRVGGGILLAAALVRFLIAAGTSPALALPEPIIGISIRTAVVIVGGFELVVALFCLFGRWPWLQLGGLALLATGYAVYVLVLLAKGVQVQASCLGSLTDPLRIYRGITGFVLQFIPFGLALGSYAAAVLLALSAPSQTARLSDGRVAMGTGNPDDNLKMTCVLCGGHIEFPPHAVGQKTDCPHCAKTITLLKPA